MLFKIKSNNDYILINTDRLKFLEYKPFSDISVKKGDILVTPSILNNNKYVIIQFNNIVKSKYNCNYYSLNPHPSLRSGSFSSTRKVCKLWSPL